MRSLAVVLLLAACGGSSTPPPSPPTSPPTSSEPAAPRTIPAAPWSIAYSDGSANAYQVASDGEGATFEYRPVTPEHSSTGMYSGGAPRAGGVDATKLAELWRQVRALEANPALHTTERIKGTGALTVTDATGTREVILLRGPALLAFDELLQGL